MIRVAFGSLPKDSGTFTFYRNQRQELLKRGIDMRCVAVGAEQHDLWNDDFADDGCVILAPNVRNMKHQARIFADWCVCEQIDIVIGLNSSAILSALPHLPENIRVVARCANAFDHGYRITMAGRDRLARVIALSPRLRDDLLADYGANEEILRLIPNGIDPVPFEEAAAITRGMGDTLQLGFVGRLEHNQKGVLHLPAIVTALQARGIQFHLRIAGEGRHADELRKRLAGAVDAGLVSFVGKLAPNEIPQFHAASDIYAFTSRFEGIPNALLEAMMAGTAPVSFLIDGITDFVIEHGQTGLICAQGDADDFADQVALLAQDRRNLTAIAKAAAAAARERFSASRTADAYAAQFREVMTEPPPSWTPVPWSEFEPDPNFRRSTAGRIAQHLPQPLVKWLTAIRNLASEFLGSQAYR